MATNPQRITIDADHGQDELSAGRGGSIERVFAHPLAVYGILPAPHPGATDRQSVTRSNRMLFAELEQIQGVGIVLVRVQRFVLQRCEQVRG